MSKPAAIYARYSTDLQNERSIADQISVSIEWAMKNGYSVMATYTDAALSGGSMIGRDGLLNLMAAAKAGQFQAVIVESVDRLSRDMADLAEIHKRLKFAGVEIVTLNEGVADTITIGLRGIVGQLYREDLAHKTRRGMRGKVSSGLSAGGRSYGYDLHPRNKGELIIRDDEADIVRRIFADYAAGKSPQTIAADLNRAGVPGPRATKWQPSTIYGWENRGTGILRNPLYDGRLVWNKRRFLKDPETGGRVSRLNPAAEWQTKAVEHLRIIDSVVFREVQQQCAGKPRTAAQSAAMRRGKRMLAGLLKCAGCNASLTVVGKDKSGRNRMVCTTHRSGQACPNPRTFYYEKVEALVIETMKRGLERPDMLVAYVEAFNERLIERARADGARRRSLEKRINDLDAQINRLMRLLREGIGDEIRIGQDMRDLQAQYKMAQMELAQEPAQPDVVALHPQAILTYRHQLNDLQAELTKASGRSPRVHALMRDLVHSVTVSQDPTRYGGLIIEIQGKLRLLLGETPTPTKSWETMGAGARFGRSPRLWPEPYFHLRAAA